MKEIFCDEYVLKQIDQIKGEVELKEEITGQAIIIGGLPNDAVVIKLDVDKREYKKRSAYLRAGLEYIHKGCDYCIILPNLQKAVFFELKSNNPKGYADQFVVSELFVEYCANLWNKYKCDTMKLLSLRVLLSPKYDAVYTKIDRMHKTTKKDRCKNEIQIISPGFPKRLKIQKILSN
jgi:hypothetical protein